jgi:hypothetical protein
MRRVFQILGMGMGYEIAKGNKVIISPFTAQNSFREFNTNKLVSDSSAGIWFSVQDLSRKVL